MTPAGFNPMERKCTCRCGRTPSGCFNVKLRPKLEIFADCFPGLNNFGDVDGLVERHSALCLLEWKTPDKRLKGAQVIAFKAITKDRRSVAFAVEGNAETMTVERYSVFWHGKQHRWREGTLAELKGRIKGWADLQWAPRQSASWQQALKGDNR